MSPSDTQVVDSVLLTTYDQHMQIVEAAHLAASTSMSDYWWSLWLIRRDGEWKARYERFVDWLGDFTVQPFGRSQQTYYSVMGAIDRWYKLGATDEDVQGFLRSGAEMALRVDSKELYGKNGKGPVKPEVVEQIEAGHETPLEYLRRVSELSPGEARREIKRLVEKESLFFLPDDVFYNEKSGELLVNLRWDSAEDGLVGIWTLRITATEVTPNKVEHKVFLPERLSRFLLSKFGISR